VRVRVGLLKALKRRADGLLEQALAPQRAGPAAEGRHGERVGHMGLLSEPTQDLPGVGAAGRLVEKRFRRRDGRGCWWPTQFRPTGGPDHGDRPVPVFDHERLAAADPLEEPGHVAGDVINRYSAEFLAHRTFLSLQTL